jgi:hypothetical protein
MGKDNTDSAGAIRGEAHMVVLDWLRAAAGDAQCPEIVVERPGGRPAVELNFTSAAQMADVLASALMHSSAQFPADTADDAFLFARTRAILGCAAFVLERDASAGAVGVEWVQRLLASPRELAARIEAAAASVERGLAMRVMDLYSTDGGRTILSTRGASRVPAHRPVRIWRVWAMCSAMRC